MSSDTASVLQGGELPPALRHTFLTPAISLLTTS